jgi:hypothetical protein
MTNKRMSEGGKKRGMWANMPLIIACSPHFPCPPTLLFSASTKLPIGTKWWKSFKVEQTRKPITIIQITTNEETRNDHLKSMKIQFIEMCIFKILQMVERTCKRCCSTRWKQNLKTIFKSLLD